jgi:hypothetical protein
LVAYDVHACSSVGVPGATALNFGVKLFRLSMQRHAAASFGLGTAAPAIRLHHGELNSALG